MLENIDRAQLIKWVGYYLIIGGIFTLCGGILLTVGGGLGGMVSVLGLGTNAAVNDPEVGNQLAAASAGLGIISTLAVIAGIVNILLGPAMIIVAVGLFQKRPWARMGVVIVAAVGVVASLVLAFGSGGVTQWAFLIIDAVIVYLFYTDPRIKELLGG